MSKLRPVTPISIIAALLSDVMSDPSMSILKNSKVWKDLERAKELANGLDPYLERNTSPESEVLKSLKKMTLDFDWQDRTGGEYVNGLEPEMLSGHVEGQFLKLMVAISGAERILEIGVFSGYSVLAMAEALPEGGVLVACELDPRAAKFAKGLMIPQAGALTALVQRVIWPLFGSRLTITPGGRLPACSSINFAASSLIILLSCFLVKRESASGRCSFSDVLVATKNPIPVLFIY